MKQYAIKVKIRYILKTVLEQGTFILFPIIIIRIFDLFLYKGVLFANYFDFIKTLSVIIFKEMKVILPYLFTIGIFLAIIKSWSKKIYWVLSTVFILLLLFIYLSTIQYFHTANIRLDHVILFFTFDELRHIALSETGNLFGEYLWLYLLPTICLILLIIFRKKMFGFIFHSKIAKLIAVSLIIVVASSFLQSKNNNDEKQEALENSKTYYLFESIVTHFYNKGDIEDISETKRFSAIKSFRNFMNWKGSQLQFEYPLVKKNNLKKGDLSSYFNEFNGKPNLVIVFCEGESSSFSGPAARYGSLTPNLDSIYAQSLYWPNTISNTDRTHGVFSNGLASLPHGFERGLLNLRTSFPDHLSIPKILVKNGYESTFTYGGWAYFDNYEPFLRINYVQNIHDKDYIIEKGMYHVEKGEKQFAWGIPDKQLFNINLELKKQNNQHPYFDLLLTLSLHSPYNVPDEKHYMAVSKKQFDKVNGNEKIYDNYKKVLAAITYQDEAIGAFMRGYKKRKDYENTIFLFVGDHNVRALPQLSELETHHVPLAIFSPKLKESKQFNDIVSQSDIPQSLLSIIAPYLDQKLLPKYNNWLGEGLSTNNNTSSVKPIFIGRSNGEIIGIINKDTLLLNNVMYKIKDHLIITKIEVNKRKKQYIKELKNYKIINTYVINNQKLLTGSDTLLYPNEKAEFFFPKN